MSCNWAEKLSLLMDGELPRDEAAAVSRHLEACDECRLARADFLFLRQEISSYRAELDPAARTETLGAILSTRPAPPATQLERAAVAHAGEHGVPRTARLRELLAGAWARPRFVSAAAAALALVLVAALGAMFYTDRGRRASDEGVATGGGLRRESDGGRASEPAPAPPTNETRTSVAGSKNLSGAEGGDGPPRQRARNEAVVAHDVSPPRAVARDASPSRNEAARARVRRGAGSSVPRPSAARAAVEVARGARPEAGVANAGAVPGVPRVERAARVAPLDPATHAEQAQLLLRAFRNARLNRDDLAYERERSKRLLYRNIVLRREADARGDAPTAGLLDRLEPFLLDIANLPDRPARGDVDAIRERVKRRNMIVLLQAGVAARQKAF